MFGVFEGYKENNVKVTIDNAYSHFYCLICGKSALGDIPENCPSCDSVFIERNINIDNRR